MTSDSNPLSPYTVALCRALAPTAEGQAPEWLLLVPPGQFSGRDRRAYRNDDAAAVVRNSETPIPIDLEHSTHLAAPEGRAAPAVGWVVELQAREDGSVWGRVEWTPEGAAAVTGRAYRFYSPAYLLEGRVVTTIPSVGLTNKPNLRIPALNAAANHQDDPPMPTTVPKPLLEALGLEDGATVEQAVIAINTRTAELNRAQQAAQTPDLSRYVPRADYDTALNRATQAETALREAQSAELNREIDALIQQGLETARITPATKDYHIAAAKAEGGLDRLREYLAAAAPVLNQQQSLNRQPPADGAGPLTGEAARIAAAFGNSAEDLAKHGGAA